MDILTFIARLAQSMAWPVTAVVLALLFRGSFEDLLSRLLELKFGKMTLRLEGASELLKEARKSLTASDLKIRHASERAVVPPDTARKRITVEKEKLNAAVIDATVQPLTGSQNFLETLTADPAVLFENSWLNLSRVLLEKARTLNCRVKSPSSAFNCLLNAGCLPRGFEAAYDVVKSIRQAARRHPHTAIDEPLARDFAQTCSRLIDNLNQIEPGSA